MARLTNKEYLMRRAFLQKIWNDEKAQRIFCFLSPNKQITLHSYFATSKYSWTDEQVLEYRKTRTNSEAFRAGKAFNELRKMITGEKKMDKKPLVFPLVNQEIDVKELSWILWRIAEQIREAEREKKST